MRVSEIIIENYRSAKQVRFSLNEFTCAIGANNAGKSTLMYAIELLFAGGKLQVQDFYDSEEPISIVCELCGIEDGDLQRLGETHRTKIEPLVIDGSLRLKRKFEIDVKSKFWTQQLVPSDSRFDLVEAAIAGKRKAAIRTALEDLLPEYREHFADVDTKAKALEAIERVIDALPFEKLETRDAVLPTGIDTAIDALLPETVYIPASKDVKDDLKTGTTARFGKLLGLLVDAIQATSHVDKIDESFELLHGMFNRVADQDGLQKDDRIDPIKILEAAVEAELKTQFRNATIELDIPKPELKQLFVDGQILVNDGIKNSILLKGDGVKRSVMFSMIKVYIDLVRHNKLISGKQINELKENEAKLRPYLFLFEEPELFLHPNAQQVLYSSLQELSTLGHQVCITTHSPAFFGPDGDAMFLKVSKSPFIEGSVPEVIIREVNLSLLKRKEPYQIICYESNAAAFFSDRVILVEGPSDQAYLTVLSKRINEEWCLIKSNTSIIVIGGKTNVSKYRTFYQAAGIEVFVIVDYDAMFDGFKNLDLPPECNVHREKLLLDIEAFRRTHGDPEFTNEDLDKIKGSTPFRNSFAYLKKWITTAKEGTPLSQSDIDEFVGFVDKSTQISQRAVLKDARFKSEHLSPLAESLLRNRCYILTKGTIEDYYPINIKRSRDKSIFVLNAVARIKQTDWDVNELPKFTANGESVCEITNVLQHAFA